MGAVYPTSLASFTEKENKVDIVDASHVNRLQEEVVALETELGLNPAGSLTNLVDRLALLQDTDGSVAKGTAYPTNPVDGQLFYKTDDDVLYVYNGASWDAQGQSLSNVAFEWHGYAPTVQNTGAWGVHLGGTSFVPASASDCVFVFLKNVGTAYRTVYESRFRKLSSFSTITFYTRMWQSYGAGGQCNMRLSVGSAVASTSGTNNQVTPEWISTILDISGLGNGTVYNVVVDLAHSTQANQYSYLSDLIGIIS